MPDQLREVLSYITTTFLVREDLRSIDYDASSSESGAAIESGKREAVKREQARADELADAFAAGLLHAFQARQAGQREIALDDRDPNEDAMADALVHALVRTDLAASTSEETEPYHYIYRISVDWDRLNEVASAAGVDLEAVLGERVS